MARILHVEEFTFKDALVLVAFPTTGSAGPIAGHYLQRHLELPLVGTVDVENLSGVTAIHEGIAAGAVRIFGGKVECTLEGNCPRVYLVVSELTMPSAALRAIAKTIVEQAKMDKARRLLTLEAVVRDKGDAEVHVAGTHSAIVEELATGTDRPPAARALVMGLTAEVLLEARRQEVGAGSLIVSALKDQPDGRAAAALIQALDKLIPHVKVDANPLLEEAMSLEAEVAAAQQAAKDQTPRPPQTTFI